MPLDPFYTMVQKSQKWPKTQIKGGGYCLKMKRSGREALAWRQKKLHVFIFNELSTSVQQDQKMLQLQCCNMSVTLCTAMCVCARVYVCVHVCLRVGWVCRCTKIQEHHEKEHCNFVFFSCVFCQHWKPFFSIMRLFERRKALWVRR